jgi:thiol-disulfide isomerase/thioredoxin
MTRHVRRDFARALTIGAILTTSPLVAAQGKPAPAVQWQAADGTLIRLADLKGKVVLIDFWASWCPPCKASFPALDALYRDLRARGLEILAVNLDERRRDADAFLATHPHTMPVLFDPKGESPLAFAVKGMPSSVLIDRDGTMRFTHMGYTEKALESYRQEITALLSER